VLDLETTGTDVSSDEIIEVCAIKIAEGVEQGFLCELVKGSSLSPQITKLTGITTSDLQSGRDLELILYELLDFIEDAPLVMHNAPFDMGFLERALESFDMDELENDIWPLSDVLASACESGSPTFSVISTKLSGTKFCF
jgi:DNA polymerase III epsilon subunit-like protein